MIDRQEIIKALKNETRVHDVEMTRAEARDLTDVVLDEHEALGQALDEAQGDADAIGTDSYIIVKITGSRL